MSGQANANDIKRTDKSLAERGIPDDSFFGVKFPDGSNLDERNTNWSDMAEEAKVGYFGGTKTVLLCTAAISSIEACHGSLRASLCVPEGYKAYQAVRSQASLVGGVKRVEVVGRVIGVVKDGEVIEEQFLNGLENEVVGRRN